jgi:hypothetical protein
MRMPSIPELCALGCIAYVFFSGTFFGYMYGGSVETAHQMTSSLYAGAIGVGAFAYAKWQDRRIATLERLLKQTGYQIPKEPD